jgi:hypothetical protein
MPNKANVHRQLKAPLCLQVIYDDILKFRILKRDIGQAAHTE